MSTSTLCFLKGNVDCSSEVIQDCNVKRVTTCGLGNGSNENCLSASKNAEKIDAKVESDGNNGFCFLKGLVNCPVGRIQDCNTKHVKTCLLEIDPSELIL